MSSATNPLAAYDLTGRVAVITGAASGIGAATADALSAVGAKIVAADLNGDGAQATAAAIRERGGAAIAVPTEAAPFGGHRERELGRY
jgi:NAD(P)-dependent dehydrogenase (short-subunit alcohol dehydrogenase family)